MRFKSFSENIDSLIYSTYTCFICSNKFATFLLPELFSLEGAEVMNIQYLSKTSLRAHFLMLLSDWLISLSSVI